MGRGYNVCTARWPPCPRSGFEPATAAARSVATTTTCAAACFELPSRGLLQPDQRIPIDSRTSLRCTAACPHRPLRTRAILTHPQQADEEFLTWDAENAEASSDFAILDRDSDGALSRMELSGREDTHPRPDDPEHHTLDALSKPEAHEDPDASDDEDVSDDETEEMRLQHIHGQAFDTLDTNENAQISTSEFEIHFPSGVNVAGQTFEELDVDKSKTLDIYEFSGTAAHKPAHAEESTADHTEDTEHHSTGTEHHDEDEDSGEEE